MDEEKIARFDCVFFKCGECAVLNETDCGECSFYKTEGEFKAGQMKTRQRHKKLPADKQAYIALKYFNSKVNGGEI